MVKLLVADDETKIAKILQTFFTERGYEVHLANDGTTALECIRRERPHLILLDLRMPGPSGLEVLKAAKQLDETIKVIIITALDDQQLMSQARELGASDYVIKPFSLDYLQNEVLAKVNSSLYEDLRASNAELRKSLAQLKRTFRGIAKAFALLLNKVDPHYTHEHTARAVEYAAKVLDKLRAKGVDLGNIPEEQLLAGVLLHDIGKIFTPKEILYKSGPLTPQEWEIMRRHPVDGAEILEQIDGLQEMANIVRCHQECYDGSGYPAGLKGKDIPIGSRIAAVVDAFDAMVTDRPYRKGRSIEEAIAELKRQRGIQFDPDVVDAIVEIFQEGKLNRAHGTHHE